MKTVTTDVAAVVNSIRDSIKEAHRQDDDYCKRTFSLGNLSQHSRRVSRYSSIQTRAAASLGHLSLWAGSEYYSPRWEESKDKPLETLDLDALAVAVAKIERRDAIEEAMIQVQGLAATISLLTNHVKPEIGRTVVVVRGRKIAHGMAATSSVTVSG